MRPGAGRESPSSARRDAGGTPGGRDPARAWRVELWGPRACPSALVTSASWQPQRPGNPSVERQRRTPVAAGRLDLGWAPAVDGSPRLGVWVFGSDWCVRVQDRDRVCLTEGMGTSVSRVRRPLPVSRVRRLRRARVPSVTGPPSPCPVIIFETLNSLSYLTFHFSFSAIPGCLDLLYFHCGIFLGRGSVNLHKLDCRGNCCSRENTPPSP